MHKTHTDKIDSPKIFRSTKRTNLFSPYLLKKPFKREEKCIEIYGNLLV